MKQLSWIFTPRSTANLALASAIVLACLFLGSASTASAACSDGDGDGYGSPGDAACANGAATDCNDGNPNIFPGATERCNGADDDCDGSTDEGFTLFSTDIDCADDDNDGQPNSPTCGMETNLPLGVDCPAGEGVCFVRGTVVCSGNGLAAVCDGVPGSPEAGGEGLDGGGLSDPTVASCFDGLDNDCDGITDQGNPEEGASPNCATAELCDGIDNDADGDVDEGFGIGSACSAGIGLCQNAGVVVCTGPATSACGAQPGPMGSENTPGAGSCLDGLDNNCNGLVDLDDLDCQEAEKCDGLDNDGNGLVDDTFADLGDSCTTGEGACQAPGELICSVDLASTVCDASAATGSPEGSGATCSDGIDNDCDGLTDDEDAGCASAGLVAFCALPYRNGRAGNDCGGWHDIEFGYEGASGPVQVTAELLALDEEGNVLDSIAVENGDTAHLASKTAHLNVETRQGNRHTMFAPVPMLRVTVEDGLNRSEAYCSNIPFLQTIRPMPNAVASASGDGDIDVLVAMPRVSPASLQVLVDGVDILPGLGIDPEIDFPDPSIGGVAGPFAGTVPLPGGDLEVEELFVRTALIDDPSSNTLSMTLRGGGCGGHLIEVDGEPLMGALVWGQFNNQAFTKQAKAKKSRRGGTPANQCVLDDVNDLASWSVFEIAVSEPTAGDVVPSGATRVVGEVCHGQEIASANINSFPIDVSSPIVIPGDGMTSATTVKVPFDVMVPQTDLRAAIDSGQTGGSFTAGANRLIAQAIDTDFNTTYDRFIFALGPIVPVGSALGGGGSSARSFSSQGIAQASEANLFAGQQVDRAFVLGIANGAFDEFFAGLRNRNKLDLRSKVRAAFLKIAGGFRPDISGACDPWTTYVVPKSTFFDDTLPIEFDLMQDKIETQMNFPNIFNEFHFRGECGNWWLNVDVDVDVEFKRTGVNVSFEFTEDQIENRTPPIDLVYDGGASDNGVTLRGGVDIGGVVGFFYDVADFFVNVLTFGLVDLPNEFSIEITGDDIKARLGLPEGDPLEIILAKFENRDLPDFGMRQNDSLITDVEINPDGLAASIGSFFEPDLSQIDPDAEDIQGTPLKNAPLPQPPIVDHLGRGVGGLTFAVSGDVFNQLFSSAVLTGRLKTEFETVLPISNFIPEDCTTIADSVQQARCVGFNRGFNPDEPFACAADYGLGQLAERRACRRASLISWNFNISPATEFVLNGRTALPPVLLLDDDNQCPSGAGLNDPCRTEEVETVLRFQDIVISFVVDRDGNSMFDGGDLDAIPQCALTALDDPNPGESMESAECLLWRLCMVVDANFDLEVKTTILGRERIGFKFGGIDVDASRGLLCDGEVNVPELDFFNDQAGNTTILEALAEKLRENTPGLDSIGLDLGGNVSFERDRIVAIETQNPADDDGFQDYIGITGSIVATPEP